MRTTDPADTSHDPTLPNTNDPGGAHAKGYTAEAAGAVPVPDDGPLPVADAPKGATIRRFEDDDPIGPTGRSEPRPRNENDTLMGSDR